MGQCKPCDSFRLSLIERFRFQESCGALPQGAGRYGFFETQPVKDTGNDRWLRQHRGVTPPREEIREWPAIHLPAISVIQS